MKMSVPVFCTRTAKRAFIATFSSSLNAVETADARAIPGNVFTPSIIRKMMSDRPRKLSQA